MKKICLLVLSLLMMIAGASALAACGGGGEETYAIDSTFTFADAELGETYRPDLSGAKVVGSNGTVSDLTVTIKDNAYTRPDGTTGMLLAGQFRADQLGDYTVVLTASDESVEDVTKTITVKDTVGPTITPGNIADMPTTALIGQTVTVPTLFTAQDAGTLVGEVKVSVLDPEGETVSLDGSNAFKPSMAGDYTIVATQSDESGNEGRYEAKVNVYNAQFDPAVAVYFSSEYGMIQGGAWPGHEAYISESFVADVTQQDDASIAAAPDGTKAATKITGATGGRFTYYVNMAQTDLSGYDYIGMWIYNDSDLDCIFELASPAGTGVNVNHFRFPANAWSFWAINLTVDGVQIPAASTGLYEVNEVSQFAFYVTQEGKALQEWTLGDSLYFTDFALGSFEDDKLASYDQPFGAANLTQFGAEVNVANVTYSTETKQEGTDGSLKVTFTADTCTTYNLKMYGFNDITADNAGESYYMWVYNPNDYAIRFYGGDTAAQDIAANSGGYVKITIKANGGHNMGVNAAWQTNVMPAAGNGATFGIGDCFYIGALYREAPADVPEDPEPDPGPDPEIPENTVAQFASVSDLSKLGGYTDAHMANFSFAFIEDVTANESGIAAAPDGTKAAVKMSPTADGKAQLFTIKLDKQDISGYDYVGMWIYNPNDTVVRLFMTEVSGTTPSNVFNIAANSWGYWAWNVQNATGKAGGKQGATYDKNAVTEIGFTVEGMTLASQSIYFTSVVGGFFKDGQVADFDEEYGMAFITAFGAEKTAIASSYNTDTAYAQSGAAGSTKFEFIAAAESFQARLAGFNGITEADLDKTVELWVYNPNDFAITVADTVIEAQSSAIVRLTIGETGGRCEGTYGAWNTMVTREDGSDFAVGDCLYFGSMLLENRVAAAFSSEVGMEQGDAWPGGHDVYISESFVADVTQQGEASIAAAPDGTKSATKVTGATGGRFTYCIQMAKTDLTGYDYIGMWIYNDSDIDCIFELGAGGGSGVNVNHFRFPANAWSYWVINLTVDGIKLPGTSTMYELDDVQELAFYVTQVGKDMKEWTKGDSLYFTDFILGNFEDDKLASYDQPFGAANLTQFGAEVGVANVTYSTETKQEGTDGSLKVTFTADTCTTYNLKMYGFNDITADNAGETYYLWVYNPNDYAIRFYGGDTAAQDIAAQSGGYVKITIKANGGHNMGVNAAWQTNVMPAAGNGATFGIGDCFYIGALYRVAPSDVSGAEQA